MNNHIETAYKPNKSILSVNGETLNKWYWVTSDAGYTNFPSGVTYGFVKYLSPASGIIVCILISSGRAICTNIYNNSSWGGWNYGSKKQPVIRKTYYYENKTFSTNGYIELNYTPPVGYTRLGFVSVNSVGAVVSGLYIEENACTDSKIKVWHYGSSITTNLFIVGLYALDE